MGKHSAPGLPDTRSAQAGTQTNTRTGTEHLHPSQFGTATGGKHRSPFSTNNPSFGTRVKEDMKRRQSGIPSHAKPGKHAKPYNAEEDISKSVGNSKPYQAKHDMLGLNKPKPVKGKITKNYTDSKKSAPPRHAGKIRTFVSKHEGRNKKHIADLVK